MHLPQFMVDVASLCAKMKYGYSYDEMRPIDALKDNEIPILFIHGQKDDFILPRHSINMQKATKGYSEIWLVEEATHAASVLFDKQGWKQHVESFLDNIR